MRYSRRMAIVANIFVGLWRFLDVFLEILQKQRRQLMHSLLTRYPTFRSLTLSKQGSLQKKTLSSLSLIVVSLYS